MKSKWSICSNCGGDGHCLPDGLRGEMRSEDWDADSLDTLVSGGYDVPCAVCEGTGKVRGINFVFTLVVRDRAYGGPEEGGWWFDCGEPVDHPFNRGFTSRGEARAYEFQLGEDGELDDALEELNEGRAELSSVTCEGVYDFMILEADDEGKAKPFPEFRPHYE